MVLGAAMANKRLSINEAYNKVRRKQYLQPVCHAPNIIIAPSPPLSSVPLDIRLATAAAPGMRGAPPIPIPIRKAAIEQRVTKRGPIIVLSMPP